MSLHSGEDRFSPAETETTTRSIDWTDPDPVSSAVVDAISTSTGVDTTSLPPLQEFVDADALNRLFVGDTHGELNFEYAGLPVVVSAVDGVTVG